MKKYKCTKCEQEYDKISYVIASDVNGTSFFMCCDGCIEILKRSSTYTKIKVFESDEIRGSFE